MAHVFNPKNKDKLISEERKEIFKPVRLLSSLGLDEGMTLFDVGCGNGFFAIPAAEIVGNKGAVFGFDLSQEMLDHLNNRAKESDINNIKTFQVAKDGFSCSEVKREFNLKADFMIMANILHEVPDMNEFLDEYIDCLLKSGRLLIIEWRKKETEEGPGLGHRLAPKKIVTSLKSRGLKPIFSKVISNNYYLILLEKML